MRLYIVVPCYNEEEVIHETAKRLNEKMNALISDNTIDNTSKVVFVDDGSNDNTWGIIGSLNKANSLFFGIKLSANKGHQNALLAGLEYAKNNADAAISMDADLQDDINCVDEMTAHYKNGADIVYAVRENRKTDTAFKRGTAQMYYKILGALGVNIVYNHADYRLMSRRALEGLFEFREVNLFLRGIVPLIGYKTQIVKYARAERFAGESKYPLKKMLGFALDGITSFSIKPIRMITVMGFLSFMVSVCFLVYAFVQNIWGYTVSGWSSLIISVWLLGGLILFALGIIGEYIGKIYKEVKQRPRYIVEEILGEENE